VKVHGIKPLLVVTISVALIGAGLLIAKLIGPAGPRHPPSLPNPTGPEPAAQRPLNDPAPGDGATGPGKPADSDGETQGAPARAADNIAEPTLPGISERELTAALYAAQANQICKAQDAVMQMWPRYSILRDQLHRELAQQLDGENVENEELVGRALTLREQFWQAGGNSSPDSYRNGYLARLLLEIAHRKAPEDLAITDELVETMQAVEVSWAWVQEAGSYKKVRNDALAKEVLQLRLAQFDQIKKEVERGRAPTWADFVRANDLPLLLGKMGDFAGATQVVQWEIRHAGPGGWTAYLDPLERSLGELNKQDVLEFNIYWAAKSGFPEEFKYARRLPSFRGPRPQQRGVTPVHQLGPLPVWGSATEENGSS
jgi:hypothetical protein